MRFEEAVENVLARAESDEERAAALRVQEKIAAARVAFPFTVTLRIPPGTAHSSVRKPGRCASIDRLISFSLISGRRDPG